MAPRLFDWPYCSKKGEPTMRIIWLAALLSLCGCATLSPGGKEVRLTHNPEMTRNCKFLKQVEVKTPLSGTGEIAGQDSLMIQLRNETAKVGGDTVFVEQARQGYAGLKALGTAYDCRVSQINRND